MNINTNRKRMLPLICQYPLICHRGVYWCPTHGMANALKFAWQKREEILMATWCAKCGRRIHRGGTYCHDCKIRLGILKRLP